MDITEEVKKMKLDFEVIVKKNLNIETLKVQYSDAKDFHEVSVWQLSNALEDAYMAGYKSGATNARSERREVGYFPA